MRLPLLPVLFVLAIAVAMDVYIWRRLRVSCRSVLWGRLQAVSSVVLSAMLLMVVLWPKGGGGDASLERMMWVIYAYFSVYVPKTVAVVSDVVAYVPVMLHRCRAKWLTVAGMVVAVIVFLTMWWGALVNRFEIDVRHVDVVIDDLPEAFDGYTIAQISDLHVGTYGSDTSFVAEVVDKVNGLKPDLIAFTGDIVNRHSSELPPFMSALSRLKAPDGVYSILGNHDYGDYYNWPSEKAKRDDLGRLIAMQGDMGWKMLNNATSMIVKGRDSIALIGVENVGDPPFNTYGDLDEAYPTLDDQVVKILLSHNPAHWNDDIKDSPDKNIALTLSGHTHAMQICLFGLSPAAIRYPTWGGLYEDDDRHQLYVNIGIGEVAIPARIGATPEITLITLKSNKIR